MRTFAALALVGATLAALSASAQTIAGYGRWNVVAGRAPDDQSHFCAMTSQTADGRAFHVIWMEQDRDLRLRIRDRRWQIAPGESVPVRVSIDERHTWTARGRPLDPRLLEIRIANHDIATWERAWRQGLRMEIAFPNSAEPTWRFSLEGTNRATDAFVRCIDQAQGAPRPREDIPEPLPASSRRKTF